MFTSTSKYPTSNDHDRDHDHDHGHHAYAPRRSPAKQPHPSLYPDSAPGRTCLYCHGFIP